MKFWCSVLIFLQVANSNLFCGSSPCSSCLQGYAYKNISCVPLCPTGFTLSSGNCVQTQNPPRIFNLEFDYFTDLSASCIDQFCHPLNKSFIDSNRFSPIPTLMKGFYFEPTSGLKSSYSSIPGPDFSYGIYIRTFSPGSIFQILEESKVYFSLITSQDEFVIRVLLTSSDNSDFYYEQRGLNNNIWTQIRFNIKSYENLIRLYSSLFDFYYLKNHEFRAQVPNLQFIYGSLNNAGFKGFIFKSSAENYVIFIIYFNYPLYCKSDSPFYYGTCTNCKETCNTWPQCNYYNCNYCFSNKCLNCTGLAPGDCVTCSDPNLEMCLDSLNCDQGTLFNCLSCTQGHILVSRLCILPLTFQPLLNIKFDRFSKLYGGIFQNGKNETTYAPYNNPEDDDPIPLHSRGLYFNNYRYLISKEDINLNVSFSIFLWYRTSSTTAVISYANSKLLNGADSYIKLSNSARSKQISIPSVCFSDNWNLIGMIVEYSNKVTDVKVYCTNKIIGQVSTKGYYFNSPNMTLVIQASERVGLYVYQLVISQYAVDGFTNEVDICGNGNSASCLSTLLVSYYNNTRYKAATLCEANCTRGCRYWGTCNQCSNILCESCESYNDTCNVNESFNPCVEGFELSVDRTTCCYPFCATCKGQNPTDCLNCRPDYLLLGNECLEDCPLGYTLNNSNCIRVSNILISFELDMILDNFTTTNNVKFYTGNDFMFYPEAGTNDPIPAKNRGYYFNGTSYMRSDPILLPFHCTFSLWVRILKPGILIEKSNLLFSSDFKLKYFEVIYTKSIVSDSWQIVHFSKKINGNKLEFNLRLNGVLSKGSYDFIYEAEKASSLTIGNNIIGFTGFIWKFKIVDTYINDNSLILCNSTRLTDCLNNCNIQDYFNGSQCIPCSETCKYGCVRDTDCNLCSDTKCLMCDNFKSGCLECTKNAKLLNECVCKDEFYWNSSTLKCERCQVWCSICNNIFSCDHCYDSFTYINNTCSCRNHEYFNSKKCNQCHELCKECDGPSENQCLSCNDPYLYNNNTCNCPIYFFKENNSCSNCLPNCELCQNLTHCSICENNLSFTGNKCSCLEGQYRVGNYCFTCNQSCLTCYESEYYHCSSCDKAELMGICYEVCPLGFNPTYKTCLVSDLIALEFKFESEKQQYIDKKSMITAETCKTPNQILIEAIKRGIYLDGSCIKLEKNNERLILVSPNFYVALWIRVSKDTPILSLNSNKDFNIEIKRTAQGIISNLNISGIKSILKSGDNIELKIWTHLIVGLKYNGGSNLVAAINNFSTQISYISEKPYKDDILSVFYLGSTLNLSEFYSGFLYSFQLFTDFPDQKNIFLDNCIQVTSIECLINCEVNEFYDNRCNPCPRYCNYTCISSTKCEDCEVNCVNCNKYNKTECFKCEKGYELTNNRCEECKNGTYYNENSEKCEDCGNNCINCNTSDKNMCFKCIKGFILENEQCKECENGTYFNENSEKCEDCDYVCINCNHFDRNVCFECEKGYVLNKYKCIECKDETFYNEIINKCQDCGDNCLYCNKSNKAVCFICEEGFIMINNSCTKCKYKTYYNEVLNKCEDCGELCEICESLEKCSQCVEHGSLINGTCECNRGFINKNGCIKDYFYANLSISFNNDITIIFSEPLKKELSKDSFSVEINKEVVNVEIIEKDSVHLKIAINSGFQKISVNKYEAVIVFLKEIYSVNGSPLYAKSFKAQLYTNLASTQDLGISKSYLKSTISSAITASAFTSIIFLDPSTIFNLMNMIELFNCVVLYDIEIHESLVQFIEDLNSQLQIPNIFKLFLSSNSKTPENYSRLSYNSSLFILNAGMNLPSLFFIFFLYAIVSKLSLSSNKKIKKIFKLVLSKIKYSIFIRFYIQTCFQISVCCYISLKYTDLDSPINIIDYSLSVALSVSFN